MKKYFNKNGLTMVEIIMTIAIFGIAVCPLMSMFYISQRINYESDIKYKSMTQAQLCMEEIQSMETLDTNIYIYNSVTGAYERIIDETENNFAITINLKADSTNLLYTIEISVTKGEEEVNSLTGSKIFSVN